MKCEATTKAGNPCARYAIRGERFCTSHLGTAHRKTKLTAELASKITTALRSGNFQHVAARFAGIDPSTFYEWMTRGEAGEPQYAEFRESVLRARADSEVHAVTGVRAAMTSEDANVGLKARTWFLEHAFPERWGRRQVLQHEGREGGPVDLRVDFGDEEVRNLGHALLEKLSAAVDD